MTHRQDAIAPFSKKTLHANLASGSLSALAFAKSCSKRMEGGDRACHLDSHDNNSNLYDCIGVRLCLETPETEQYLIAQQA